MLSRTAESLSCSAAENSKVFCVRKQTYFLREKSERFVILDASTFSLSDKPVSDAVSGVTTEFYISVKTEDGKIVRLLDAPGQNTGYASQIAGDLKNQKLPLKYVRNEKVRAIILLSLSLSAAAVIMVYA